MRHGYTAALAGLALLAGCGSNETVSPEVADAEIALNASPQDIKADATTAEDAALVLGNRGIVELKDDPGGDWKAESRDCKPSGPVESCEVVITGAVICKTNAAVRVLDGGIATVRRVAYICNER
ncbi:MAG: hypothetical protein ABWZ63_11760 [Thermoleophilaceae bacterium]